MAHSNQTEGVREAVAVFDTAANLQNAIDELLSSGFHRAELSLLASEADVVSKLGHKYRKSSELDEDPSVPRTAYVSTEAIGCHCRRDACRNGQRDCTGRRRRNNHRD